MKMYNFTVNITVEAKDDEAAGDLVKKSLGGFNFEDFYIEDGPNELDEDEGN